MNDSSVNTMSSAQRSLPPESPLAMPRHEVHEARQLRSSATPNRWGVLRLGLARLMILGLTASLSIYGVSEMYGVLRTNTVTVLQWVFLTLFSINFIWIAFAFAQAMLGFLVCLNPWRRSRLETKQLTSLKTAILLPVYCEEPRRVAAAIRAMRTELLLKAPGQYAFFILSDTNQAHAWLAEEHAFMDLVNSDEAACPVYYRKRLTNTERKAGNIADWVSRWGGAYPAMVVLDADSLMSADTLLTLSHRLAVAPDVGLIQTLPTIVRAKSLYGRLQQFANHCYGPIYAAGLAAWHGCSSNFWGHNAIIRTQAFAQACSLPILSGKPPFGGHVLSHDFIEAAFLRRAGWGVRFDTDLSGSYEEAPSSLVDVLIRDRRWCQGNLQHSRLLRAQGLAFASRIHILAGIFSYLSAVFWLLLIVLGLAIALQAFFVRPEYFGSFSLFPIWPVFDAERALNLFYVSMAVVFAPKLFAWFSALLHFRQCRAFGGPILLTLSTLLESLLSALYAPILMVAQFGVVCSILMGRDSGWKPQSRDDGALSWAAVWRVHRGHTLFGIPLAAVAYLTSFELFLWLLPISGGLMLSMPLSWGSGGKHRLRGVAGLGLLRAPEEKRPSEILSLLNQEVTNIGVGSDVPKQSLQMLFSNDQLCNWHIAQLPKPAGESKFHAAAVTAEWKIRHAEGSLPQLESWLTPDELLAVLARQDLLTLITGVEYIQAPHVQKRFRKTEFGVGVKIS